MRACVSLHPVHAAPPHEPDPREVTGETPVLPTLSENFGEVLIGVASFIPDVETLEDAPPVQGEHEPRPLKRALAAQLHQESFESRVHADTPTRRTRPARPARRSLRERGAASVRGRGMLTQPEPCVSTSNSF